MSSEVKFEKVHDKSGSLVLAKASFGKRKEVSISPFNNNVWLHFSDYSKAGYGNTFSLEKVKKCSLSINEWEEVGQAMASATTIATEMLYKNSNSKMPPAKHVSPPGVDIYCRKRKSGPAAAAPSLEPPAKRPRSLFRGQEGDKENISEDLEALLAIPFEDIPQNKEQQLQKQQPAQQSEQRYVLQDPRQLQQQQATQQQQQVTQQRYMLIEPNFELQPLQGQLQQPPQSQQPSQSQQQQQQATQQRYALQEPLVGYCHQQQQQPTQQRALQPLLQQPPQQQEESQQQEELNIPIVTPLTHPSYFWNSETQKYETYYF